MSARGTFTVTSAAPAPTMTMPVEVVADCPTVRSILPTVPAMGALRVAPSRSPWAWVTASWSCRMATSSAATRVAELLPPPAALPEPPVLRVALVATPADEAAEEGAPPLEPADDAADEAADEPEGCADELDPEDVAVAACMITVNSWAICVARPVSAVSAACWVLEADAIAVAQVRSWSALGVVLPWPGAGLVGEPVGFGVSVGVPVGGTVGVPVGGTVGVPVGGTVGVPVGGRVAVPEGSPVVGVAVPVAAGPGVVCGVKAAGLTRGDDEGPVLPIVPVVPVEGRWWLVPDDDGVPSTGAHACSSASSACCASATARCMALVLSFGRPDPPAACPPAVGADPPE